MSRYILHGSSCFFLKKYIFTCGIWQSTANKYCCIFVYDPCSFKNHFVTITNRKTHFSFITTNFALFRRVLNPEIKTVNINIKSKFPQLWIILSIYLHVCEFKLQILVAPLLNLLDKDGDELCLKTNIQT